MIPGTFPVGGAPPPATITLTDTSPSNFSKNYTIDIGDQNSTRLVIICVSQSFFETSHGAGITSATIGGVNAAILAHGSTGGFEDSLILAARVPAGTTASLVFNGGFSNFYSMAFSVYAANFVLNATPSDTATFSASGAGNSSIAIDVPANGILVAVNGTNNYASFGTPSFGGIARDYYNKWTQSVTSPARYNAHESGSLSTSATLTNYSVSSSGVSDSANGLAVASFR